MNEFKSTGVNQYGQPRERLSDAEWTRLNNELSGDNIRMVEHTHSNGNKYMKFERISNDSGNINTATHAPKVQTPNTPSPINDFLAHSSTLQDLNSQGRLTLTTSSTLNGKQYMRISMGNNPNMQETQTLIQKLQNEGFYVSSNSTQSGEKFIGVSRENIFTPWSTHPGNWAFNKAVVPEVFDASKMRVSDGSGKLYVRNSASEMLGHHVNGDYATNEIDRLYGVIRRGIEYPVDNTKVSKAIHAMEKPNNSAILYHAPSPQYSWHVHSYKGATNAPVSEINYHVSLNVSVDDEFIRKLDNIIAKDQGQHIINFKIPPEGPRWKTMADPISIYMRSTNPEIERAIANAAKKYIRTTSETGLQGRKIDNGIAIAYETSGARKDIVADIINKVAQKTQACQ